ncbi:uncharacterized protein LOC103748107 [Nannospalax galili]|uniref:uncharacterized protein LOC103748107 n=1 Tax=Nannospalax galili TaxID=1026970 RepID=UPI0004ED307F|nr:uncharacterized protein LOC103748107 [Nannospalax galili]
MSKTETRCERVDSGGNSVRCAPDPQQDQAATPEKPGPSRPRRREAGGGQRDLSPTHKQPAPTELRARPSRFAPAGDPRPPFAPPPALPGRPGPALPGSSSASRTALPGPPHGPPPRPSGRPARRSPGARPAPPATPTFLAFRGAGQRAAGRARASAAACVPSSRTRAPRPARSQRPSVLSTSPPPGTPSPRFLHTPPLPIHSCWPPNEEISFRLRATGAAASQKPGLAPGLANETRGGGRGRGVGGTGARVQRPTWESRGSERRMRCGLGCSRPGAALP